VNKAGIEIRMSSSEPPASRRRTVLSRSSDRRDAITDPADPDPMIM